MQHNGCKLPMVKTPLSPSYLLLSICPFFQATIPLLATILLTFHDICLLTLSPPSTPPSPHPSTRPIYKPHLADRLNNKRGTFPSKRTSL